MKSIIVKILLLTSPLLLTGNLAAQKNVGATGASRIEVIDFHSTHRCKTCLAIESIAREVVEKEFPNEFGSGKIVFKTVDVDDERNAKIAEKFEAAGTALFVYNCKTGQAYDLTDAGFSYALNNEAKLREQIRNAIRKNLYLL